MDNSHLVVGGGTGIGQALVKKILQVTSDRVIAIDRIFEEFDSHETDRIDVYEFDIDQEVNWSDLLSRHAKLASLSFLVPSCRSRDTAANELGFTSNFVKNVGNINFSLLQILQAARPYFSEKSYVVIVSSVLGSSVAANLSLDYHAAKSILESIAKYMAVKLAPTVCVNVLAPGLIARNESSALITDQVTSLMVRLAIPLQRPYSQEEIAAAMWVLASGQLGCITGQVIHMDGGAPLQESFYLLSRATSVIDDIRVKNI